MLGNNVFTKKIIISAIVTSVICAVCFWLWGASGTIIIGVPPTEFHHKIAQIVAERFQKVSFLQSVKVVDIASANVLFEAPGKPDDLRAENAFDVFIGDAADILQLSAKGVLLNLQENLEKNIWADFIVKPVDVKFAIPIGLNDLPVIYVNKSIFEQVPQSLEELFMHAKNNSNAGKMQYGMQFPVETGFIPLSVLSQAGAVKINFSQNEVSWDKEITVQVATLMLDAALTELSVPTRCSGDCATEEFKKGRSGFFFSGNWRMPEYFHKSAIKTLAIRVPELNKKISSTLEVSGVYLAMNENLTSKKRNHCIDLLKNVLTEQVQEKMLLQVGINPIRNPAQNLSKKAENILMYAFFSPNMHLIPIEGANKYLEFQKRVGAYTQDLFYGKFLLNDYVQTLINMQTM